MKILRKGSPGIARVLSLYEETGARRGAKLFLICMVKEALWLPAGVIAWSGPPPSVSHFSSKGATRRARFSYEVRSFRRTEKSGGWTERSFRDRIQCHYSRSLIINPSPYDSFLSYDRRCYLAVNHLRKIRYIL